MIKLSQALLVYAFLMKATGGMMNTSPPASNSLGKLFRLFLRYETLCLSLACSSCGLDKWTQLSSLRNGILRLHYD